MRLRINRIVASVLVSIGVLSVPADAAVSPARNFSKKFKIVLTVVQEKCMACHTRNFNLPFYSRIPGIKEIIEKDYRDGLRALNLTGEFAFNKPLPGTISEAALAKMEWVIQNDTMPPAKFAVVHWGSRLKDGEKKTILEWVGLVRARYYATGTASPKMAREPLQPLPESVPVNFPKVDLGKKLFEDKRLSGDNTVACVGCHAHEKAGTDNRRFSEGVRGQTGIVNAPSVYNALFNIRQFWDGRAADLQEQAGGPPFNPVEMDSVDWDQIIAKLAADDALTGEFEAVYPDGWSGKNITDAIAEYEKILLTPDSRFDRWLRGKGYALTPEERSGYERFKAYRCATCHVGKAIGGQSFEYMDLKRDYFADRGSPLDSDIGLKGFTGKNEDLHKFKVPSLRNVELTWPYFHDGTVATLDEAVRLMGIYLSGIDVPDVDRKRIVAFLRTLTGEYRGRALRGSPVEN